METVVFKMLIFDIDIEFGIRYYWSEPIAFFFFFFLIPWLVV